jgi:dipeptidyl aminopeptidase/acylaminoacyl peptidase
MRYSKLVSKIFFGMFILPLLMSCALRPSQSFIFESYDLKDNNDTYYTTDLYNPSKIQKLDPPVCASGDALSSEPTWSPNGKYYFCPTGPFYINSINPKTLTGLENDGWGFESWSPDGQYLTIGYDGGLITKPYFELAVIKNDGTKLTQLAKDSIAEIPFYSIWAPNGKYLAYLLDLTNQDDMLLVIVDIKGNNIARFDLRKLTNNDFNDRGYDWSPDSKKLTCLGSYGWYILDTESGKLLNLERNNKLCSEDTPEWSPDGEKLLLVAFNCQEIQSNDPWFVQRVYAINSDGSNLKFLTDKSVGNAHWSPDGKSIVFDKYTDQGSEIFIMNADGTNQRNLFGNQSHLSFIQWITP